MGILVLYYNALLILIWSLSYFVVLLILKYITILCVWIWQTLNQ